MASIASLVQLPSRLWNTPSTRRSNRSLRSSASIVFVKLGGSGADAIAATATRSSAMARSNAAGKCSGLMRSNGGVPNGVSQVSKNGLSLMRILGGERRYPQYGERRGGCSHRGHGGNLSAAAWRDLPHRANDLRLCIATSVLYIALANAAVGLRPVDEREQGKRCDRRRVHGPLRVAHRQVGRQQGGCLYLCRRGRRRLEHRPRLRAAAA